MCMVEIFLNFPLHPELRPYSGLDITYITRIPYKKGWDQDSTRVWKSWTKNLLGLTDCPYWYLKLMILVKFIIYGERKDPLNPFQWSHNHLNLPGDESYTHKLPWVMKVRLDGHLSSKVLIYVDDGGIISHSELVCWQAANRFFRFSTH